MSNTYKKVRIIISDLLDVDKKEITPQTRFREDLHAHPQDLRKIIRISERKFNAHIPLIDIDNIYTVGQAVDHIHSAVRPPGDISTPPPLPPYNPQQRPGQPKSPSPTDTPGLSGTPTIDPPDPDID